MEPESTTKDMWGEKGDPANVLTRILGWIVGLLGNMILGIVAIILWLVLMFKAFQGQEWEVPIIGKYARQYSSSATI